MDGKKNVIIKHLTLERRKGYNLYTSMTSKTIYFFANLPQAVQMFIGFANIIRGYNPEYRIVLIKTSHPRMDAVGLEGLEGAFDDIIKVGFCSYPSTDSLPHYLDSIRRINAYARDINRLKLEPGSTLFLTCWPEAVTNILLRKLKREGVRTVALKRAWAQELLHITVNRRQTFFANIVLKYYGAVPVDMLSFDIVGAGDKWAIPHLREDPFSDSIYFAGPNFEPPKGPFEMYRPYYFPSASRSASRETVVVFGEGCLNSLPKAKEAFAARFNQILRLIREKHSGARFVYKHHPGSVLADQNFDLNGYEIEPKRLSEAMYVSDPAISTVYGIASEAIQHAPFFGIRGFFLYHLFDDNSISKRYKNHLDLFYEIHKLDPRMFIRSIDDWLAGKNEYSHTITGTMIKESVERTLRELKL